MVNKPVISNDAMLQLLKKKFNMDEDAVQKEVEMEERNKSLDQHKYAIKQGPDGRWHTYLPDDTKKNGRRQIAKSTREKLDDAIVEFYQKVKEEQTMTFEKAYAHWADVQKSRYRNLSPNTITKYWNDYRRCIQGTDFATMDITQINSEMVEVFLGNVIYEKQLPKRAFTNLVGYMRGTFESARVNRIINENPFAFISTKSYYDSCKVSDKTPEDMTVSSKEMQSIISVIDAKLVKRPSHMALYAILMASLTGMRVGELSALRWDNVHPNFIFICEEESRIVTKGKPSVFVILPHTKNKKNRVIPVTTEIQQLITIIRNIQTENGLGEATYVFENHKGRLHTTAIADAADKVSKKAGLSNKSIHCYRKTLSSQLHDLNVSDLRICSMLGHTKEVNAAHYTFDLSDIETKKEALSKVNSKVVNLDAYKGAESVIKNVINSGVM